MAHVYAICNQKGGVGKTLTAWNLARAAVLRGRRVLLGDIDPQGNLTTVATREPLPEGAVSLADALSDRAKGDLPDVIVAGVWDGLSVIPGGRNLALVRDELVTAGAGREHRLREQLVKISDSYDLVLLDCPPSLDLLTVNALTAAEKAVVVTHASLFSANGMAELRATIEAIKGYTNPELTIGGAIVNGARANTKHSQHWTGELQAALGSGILEPHIPLRSFFGEACEAGIGLDEYGSPDADYFASVYDKYLTAIDNGATR